MLAALSTFIALIALAWGLAAAALDAGAGSLPWLLYEQGLYLSGLLAIGLMSLAMVLATRPVLLERPLGGMDRIFRLHKWAGILAAVFAALHWLIEMSDDLIKATWGRAGRPDEVGYGGLFEALRDAGEDVGEFAIYLVLAMVVLSLWKRFPYKFWRHLHRAMPVFYLLLAFHAAVLAPPDYWTQPVGMLLAVLLAAGTAASVVALAGRIGRARRVQGVVTAVSSPAPDVTEIVCRLDHWRGHQAGQFAFVGFERFEGAHPFTIASADHGDRTLTFQIKALGDYTRQLAGRISTGQAVSIEGPYGRFVLERRDRKARQVWVAGGIGVTPFLAWLDELRADPAAAPAVDLHYSTRQAASDPFVARLQALSAGLPSVTLHIHDRAAGDALTPATLASGRTDGQRAEVWFCGPRGFGDQLKAGLARVWGGRMRFRREAFELR
ncbi:ferredoxin reductase family protein [Thauera phenolivorans]|uniref:ferredoxin reductase family protein n=1 Tax=Thauera phenolivorans TaxID=1792543 RepID=UPI00083A01EB|nr:ferric reductase-like transmembrane domain-containing protein [Thauera phenolivorans]